MRCFFRRNWDKIKGTDEYWRVVEEVKGGRDVDEMVGIIDGFHALLKDAKFVA
jgi:hypothetical protein